MFPCWKSRSESKWSAVHHRWSPGACTSELEDEELNRIVVVQKWWMKNDEKWWMKTDKLQSKSQHIIIFTNSTVVVWNLLRRESIPVSLGTQSILGKVAMQHFAKVWQCTTNKCSESGCWIQWREDERLSRESQVCSRASSVAHAFCSAGVTELYVNKYYICFWFIY